VTRRLRAAARTVEENGLLVVLFGATAIIVFAAAAPILLGSDFWLGLVAGREIAESGLPEEDTLTVFARGREWVDQQWLAHLFFYGLVWLGGLSLALVVGGGAALSAFVLATAVARARGGSLRATTIVAFVALLAAPWAFALRAQALALPLFAAVAWLLVDSRERVRPRTFWVLPLLVIWANVHGSVVLGAALVVWFAIAQIVRQGGAALPGAALLALLGAGAVFVTPYGPAATLRYYDRTLVDPSFADLVTEWQRPSLNLLTATFFVLAAAAVVLVVWQRNTLTLFEAGALAITLSGALTSLRGVVWFVLLALVLLPVTLDGAARLRDAPASRALNRGVAAVVAALVVAVAVSAAIRGDDWLESEWPTPMLDTLRREARDTKVRVFPTDRTADWLLWHLPDLRGRIAYDVRFELLSRQQIEALSRYHGEAGPAWKRVSDGFAIVVTSTDDNPSHALDYLAETRTRAVFRGDRAELFLRSKSTQ
jgi:hypothetical protein